MTCVHRSGVPRAEAEERFADTRKRPDDRRGPPREDFRDAYREEDRGPPRGTPSRDPSRRESSSRDGPPRGPPPRRHQDHDDRRQRSRSPGHDERGRKGDKKKKRVGDSPPRLPSGYGEGRLARGEAETIKQMRLETWHLFLFFFFLQLM